MSICAIAPLTDAILASGFCAGTLPVSVDQPRSIVSLSKATDFLTLERGTASVLFGTDLDGDGIPDTLVPLIANGDGLNHGLALSETHLYASSSTHVYRWPYEYNPEDSSNSNSNSSFAIVGDRQTVIDNINADGMGGAPGGHRTRTLAIDKSATPHTLYVSVGSNGNIDPDSFRSRIRRFPLDGSDDSVFPLDFLEGEIFADGLRNEVAMEFDSYGVLWGAGNSADNLERDDLGGLIVDDNPAEEVHRFGNGTILLGANFGYPFCWREYALPDEFGLGRGTPWAWPTTVDVVTDDHCRDASRYASPVLAMQAHSAPLGMTFYRYDDTRPAADCANVTPFPQSMDGDAFVAFHGSWNREVPTGYKVVRLPVTDDGTAIEGGIGAEPIDILASDGSNGAKWIDGFRPVDVSFDICGRLLVSSDGTRRNGVYSGDKIVRIESTQAPMPPSTPTTSPEKDLSSVTPEPTDQPSTPPVSSSVVPVGTLEPSSSPTLTQPFSPFMESPNSSSDIVSSSTSDGHVSSLTVGTWTTLLSIVSGSIIIANWIQL